MTNGDADEHFTPSRLMLRALDRKRYLDYGLAFAVGAWPILLVGQTSDWGGVLAVHLVMLAVLAIVFGLFQIAPLFERVLGETGTMVVTRLLGMLLAALSVQFVLNGLRGAGVI